MPGSAFRVALHSAGAATVIAAEFAPVPYLSVAVGLVVGILELCDHVTTNKHEVRDLGNRCQRLLYTLRDCNADHSPESLRNVVDAGQQLLEETRRRMQNWAESSRVKQFFIQNDIAEDIKRRHQAIDSFLQSYNLTSHMEIHKWMNEYEKQRQNDYNDLVAYLADIRHNQEITQQTILAMQHDVSRVLDMMAIMQTTMGTYPFGDTRHRGLQQNLYTIQKSSGQLLPKVHLEHGEVRRISNNPVGGSAAFDIWLGEYLGMEKCCIKVVRGIEVSPKIRERFLREVQIWRKVWEKDKGEYMLPFWGACLSDGPYPYMVSPWMENGDAVSYVNKHPDVNRRRIVRRIAEGLRVLHTYDPPIAHGDIKGANILINDKGDPLLADFGLSKIMEDMTGMPFTQSRGVSESYRWFAPELCSAPGILSPASDIFAYSMTVLELMTGEPPFKSVKRTPEVLIRLQQGERPARPEGQEIIDRGLDDNLWNLLTRCWDAIPENRPTIHQVLAELPEA